MSSLPAQGSRGAHSTADARPALALIVAVAANGTIGANNALPWHLPEDLRHFRRLTTGHAIVMGRRTWESLGRPLPDRQNIVVTRTPGFAAPGAETAPSLEAALALNRMPEPVFCIGGAGLFRAALPRAERVHLTEIARDFEGDTFWEPLDPTQWREVARSVQRSSGPDEFDFAFVDYARRAR